MALLPNLIFRATRRLAADPQVRAKAVEVVRHQVVPRARDAWRRARPEIEAARDAVVESARETDPKRHPGAFAARLRERLKARVRRP